MAQRWRCAKCQREWVLALGWDESQGCIYPQCREPHPELVTYTPQFRGGDIERHELPTDDEVALHATSPDAKVGPGSVTSASIPATLVPEDTPISGSYTIAEVHGCFNPSDSPGLMPRDVFAPELS